MSKRLNWYQRCLLVLLAFGSSSLMAAPFPEPRLPYGFRFFLAADYFETRSNYDSDGTSGQLGPGRYYKNYGADIGAEYWMSENSSLLLQLGSGYAESFAKGETRRNSSLREAWVGLRTVSLREPVLIVPEAGFTFPFNRVEGGTDAVLTGEGAIAAEAGVWLLAPLGPLTPYTKIGYRYRDQMRASHFVWRAGSRFPLGSATFFLGAKGESVAKKDGHTDDPTERTAVTSTVDGGSLKYYSVNPSSVSVEGGISFEIRRAWRVSAEFEQTLSGKNTGLGYTAKLGLEWVLSTTPQPRAVRESHRRRKVEHPAHKEAPRVLAPVAEPLKPAPEKPAVEKPAAEMPAPEKPTPAKPTPEKPVSAKPAPAKPTPEKAGPVKAVPAKPVPVKSQEVQPAPIKEISPARPAIVEKPTLPAAKEPAPKIQEEEEPLPVKVTPKAPLKIKNVVPKSAPPPAPKRPKAKKSPPPPKSKPEEVDTSLKDIQQMLGH